MKYVARIQPDPSKSSGYCLLSIARKPNQNLDIAPKSTSHLKIDIRIRTKNGLKITHIGLKIEAIRLKIDAYESLYIESQLKIRPLFLKIEPEIGLKIDDIGLKIAGGRRRIRLKIDSAI